MKEFFSYDSKELFIPFGTEHLTTFAIIVLLWVGILLILNYPKAKFHRPFRISLAVILVTMELSNTLWRAATGHFSVADSLPLHMCGISSFVSAIMLLTRSYYLFEFIYFMGIGGALQALLTPDNIHLFPHFDFFQHFITHGAIILAALYMVFVEKYYPKWTSIVRVVIVTNMYMVVIYIFNTYTGGNYVYLNHPPSDPSIIDLFIEIFGPHPWYIIGMELTGVASFVILILPFVVRRISDRRI
jgi:hypothetical integral membrane protein (TIGR02206 family)